MFTIDNMEYGSGTEQVRTSFSDISDYKDERGSFMVASLFITCQITSFREFRPTAHIVTDREPRYVVREYGLISLHIFYFINKCTVAKNI
jgi:hypothetical protein